jgi:amino acid adenylation domain-containing protein/non-ribosomal peptide synthase protein (TIGR01720 family)
MNNHNIKFTGKEFAPYSKYWKEKISILSSPFHLKSAANTFVPISEKRMEVIQVNLKKEQQEIISKITSDSPLEVFIVLLSNFYILLSKYTNTNELIINTPLLNKGKRDKIYEPEISLIERIRPDMTIKDLIIQINNTVTQSYKYQNFPMDIIFQQNTNHNLHTNIFIQFNEIHIAHEPSDKYDLIININRLTDSKQIQLKIEYNIDMFNDIFIKNFTYHFQNSVNHFKDIHNQLKDIEIISNEERYQIIEKFNDNKSSYPDHKTIIEIFEEQVEKTPDSTAVFFNGKKLSYKELNEHANQLAHYLKNHYTMRPDDFAGIILERSEKMIIAILAILKSGGAYLPIEPDIPEKRIQHMKNDTNVSVVLTQKKFKNLLNKQEAIFLDDFFLHSSESDKNLEHMNKASDLAYVMYTSGSTGKPKGVLVEHRSVVRLVKNTNYTSIKTSDNILQLSNYAFDGSTYDIFGALLNGATLYMITPDLLYSIDGLCSFISENNINITFITTALFNKIIDTDPEVIACFDNIYFGGQDASLKHVKKALTYRKNKDSIVHVYGPTENTTFSTYYIVDTIEDNWISIPIGAPISNSQAYILDDDLNPVPVGIVGELYVGGDGIARSYLNRIDLTSEKFIDSPFIKGKKIYRTGDLAKWLTDGNIDFLGRKDQQIKIRGFRVETGEIENILLKHPSIVQTYIVPRETNNGNKELIAYIVGKEKLNISTIRDFMAHDLPDYMIPAYFIQIRSLPLNMNGKVDKNALPDPDSVGMDIGVEYEAPQNEMESQLAQSWAQVLNRKPIGINDNFFALGGDSIKAIQIVSHLKQKNLKLEIRNLFLYPTIRELAGYISIDSKVSDNQNIIKGLVPLTPIQSWFFENHMIARHHFNQSVMLTSSQRLKEDALKAVFEKMQEHHDVFRMKYIFKQNETVQENCDIDYPLDFKTIDLISSENAIDEMTLAANISQAEINLETGPLMKIVLFRLSDGDRLLIIIHHLIIDGISWRILYNDLTNTYNQYVSGEPLDLPSKSCSFKHWSEQIKIYSNSNEFLKEKAYWRAIESADIKTLPKDCEAIEPGNFRNCQTIRFNLSKEDTAALLTKVNQAYNTEINDILLTALACCMKSWHGENRTLISLEGHGRENILDLDISQTVGWFTSMYPVILETKDSDDIGYQIKHTKETLRKIPNKGIGYGILKYMTSSENKQDITFRIKPEIIFNYLGEFNENADESLFQIARESSGNQLSLDTEVIHHIEINGEIAAQQLQLSASYNQSVYKKETIQKICDNYLQTLIEIISHCVSIDDTEITPHDIDFDGFDIDELDEFLDDFAA